MRSIAVVPLLLIGLLGPSLAPRAVGAQGTAMIEDPSRIARRAERIFRGTCTAVEPGFVELGGGRLPATTYTFEVTEHLRGPTGRTVRFRQIGSPEGGADDLGQLGGLPVYRIGVEYLLFLLPESGAGLTSPPGGGAFIVEADERLVRADRASVVGSGAAGEPPASYASVRSKVLAELPR